jgi:hypothetical protein
MRILIILILISQLVLSQDIILKNINSSQFPILSADMYAFDKNGNLDFSFQKEDLSITENGFNREIIRYHCEQNSELNKIASALVMDMSGSISEGNRYDLIIEATNSWIEALPENGSQAALISFNTRNRLLVDFTTDKSKLRNALNLTNPAGGTNFDAALIEPLTSGLLVTEPSKKRKSIIFVTDGYAPTPKIEEIIAEARRQNCRIYCITINLQCPMNLRQISENTGGIWFDRITTVDDAKSVFNKIIELESKQPCKIEWESDRYCGSNSTIEFTIENKKSNVKKSLDYTLKRNQILDLDFMSNRLLLLNHPLNQAFDTTITVLSNNQDIFINDVIINDNHFEINPKSFQLEKGIPFNLNLTFTPTSEEYNSAKIEFISDQCSFEHYVIYGKANIPPTTSTLELIHPNGDEIFFMNKDTVITWEGIPPTENVVVELSQDAGNSWTEIGNSSNLSFNWNNIDVEESDQNLIRIVQKSLIDTPTMLEWEKSFFGTSTGQNTAFKIVDLNFGTFIVAGKSPLSPKGITIAEIDSQGDVIWEKGIGGAGYDFIKTLYVFNDEIYLGVYSSSNEQKLNQTPLYQNRIIKLDLVGNVIWDQYIEYDDEVELNSIIVDESSNDILFLSTSQKESNPNVVITKLNSVGDEIWVKEFGGERFDYGKSMIEVDDGYVIAATQNNVNPNSIIQTKKAWIFKVDKQGNLVWETTLGGDLDDIIEDIVETDDGSLIVVGNTFSNNGDIPENKGSSDILIAKLNQSGDLNWIKTIGGSRSDFATAVDITKGGDILMGGITASSDFDFENSSSNTKGFIAVLNPDGGINWFEKSESNNDSFFYDAIQSQIYFYAVGTENSNFFISKFSPFGKVVQEDESNSIFSIVDPNLTSKNLDFGDVVINDFKDSLLTETVCNTSLYPIEVNLIETTQGDVDEFFIKNNNEEFTLEPGECRDIIFNFQPESEGVRSAYFSVLSKNTGTYTDIISVTGNGVAPNIEISTYDIDFGWIAQGTTKDTIIEINVLNNTNNPIEFISIELDGINKESYQILSGNNGFILQGNQNHEMELAFVPQNPARNSAFISLVTNVGVYTINLLGGAIDSYWSEVALSNYTQQAGEEFTIDLLMIDSQYMDVQGAPRQFEAELSYNGSILYFVDGICDNGFDCKLNIAGTWDGVSESIYTIPAVATLGNTDFTEIEISNFEWLNSPLETDVDLVNGSLKIDGICEDEAVRLYHVGDVPFSMASRPQPFSENIAVQIGMRETLTFDLILLDINGQEITRFISQESYDKGKYDFNFDTSDLNAGVYYIRLISNKGELLNKIIKE